ncbi:Protein CBG05243 [Caenorhabditis briggsae]|uniref:Uncharacterized protein n=2 Tax=Caenorhabditis briggsae TaxID=6238 RepID=A0AAE9A0S2_CAEBR|nr:Protein CBG05243 [Caenorhabditis briggsae]ULT84188.1 hypothetical protein L3Y34_013076 [Caenorhabditis briggsae]UMM43427.1 hypothetical protein L5515_018923 [Caenorhabditis briggsae]CAP25775.2 Protein CBG05243 [Caenorhabditis briggsae]
MPVNLQDRYDRELQKCYCARASCNFGCEIAEFCDNLIDGIQKQAPLKELESLFIEQDTLSGVLRSANGDWCDMFQDNAKEMDNHMMFIKSSLFRTIVVMQFLYNCTMGIYKSCRNRVIHHFDLDPYGRITAENGDYVHQIITDPRFNFARLFRSSIRILEHEIKRMDFTKQCVHEIMHILDLQLPEVELSDQNLANKVNNEGRKDLEKTSKQHKFMLNTYRVWHNKNRNYLKTAEKMMSSHLYKLIRMRDMHVLALDNWNDFSVIPDPFHPRNFENLFIKV